jgi:hypothetical protein
MFRVLALICLILFSAGVHAQAAADVAGRVTLAAGNVTITPAQGPNWTPKVNDLVRAGDLVVSGKDGELHLLMEDGGVVAVRPDTQLLIAEFVAEGKEGDRAVYKLLVGSLRSISGWIAKFNAKNYSVRTKTATIGVRGTDHEPTYVPAGVAGIEEGTYDKVHAGATFIENQNGIVLVDVNGIGFAPIAGKPRLLDHVPAAFKRALNDGALDEAHDRIQGRLEKLRELRRKRFEAVSGNDATKAERVEQLMQERRSGENVKEVLEERSQRTSRTEDASGSDVRNAIQRKKEAIQRARARRQQ